MPLDRARSSGMRSLLLLLLVFVAAPSFAEAPQWCSTYQCAGGNNKSGSSYQEVASAVLATQIQGLTPSRNIGAWTYADFSGYVQWSNATYYYTFTGTPPTQNTINDSRGGQVTPWCKASAAATTYTVNATRVSNLNYNCPTVGTGAPPNPCTPESGQKIVTNITAAWVKNPKASPVDAVSNVVGDFVGPASLSICAPSGASFCKRQIISSDGGTQAYVSQEPSASGLYRLSFDYITTGEGQTCTPGPSDASANPNTSNPPCPGTVGEVNGKTVCLPKVGGPALPSPSNAASAPPSGAPVTAGNPAAGDKPATGTGSGAGGVGRTPTSGGGGTNANPASGGGGNSGGSSSAAGGTGVGGTTSGGSTGGTTDAPTETTQPCGLPNTPRCKIDESGTGTGAGALDGAKGQLDTAATAQNTQVGAAGTTVTGVAWNWAFTLPAGACTPFDFSTRLGPVSINPCTNSWFGLFRSAMGYFFFGLTGFYIWHKATSAPTGGK